MDESTLSIAISGTKINRQVKIKPAGFWSDDCIIVTQVRSYRHGTYKFHDPPTILWGFGGRDAKLSDLEATKNFIAGLQEAVKIFEEWTNET